MAGFDAAKRARAIARMNRLPEAVKRNVRAQMNTNAEELTAMQKRLAPKDDGTLAGTVRHSDISNEERIAVKVEAGGPATTRPVRQGADASYDYALAIEHGREGQKAQPFFFPAYRAQRKKFKSRVSRAAKKGIAEALG